MLSSRKNFVKLVFYSILFILVNNSILQAGNGKISGKVTDGSNGEPLLGATIIIKGTSLGSATDFEGKYTITQASEGSQILCVSYIGYNRKEIPVVVKAGETIKVDVSLDFNTIDFKEVIITAQLEGQAAAINQQLSSNTIVNVVSKDKIQELPDQNAAETLGRLPGISIQRNNGEGQKVVVRGLSPRFSSITVNGVQLPATSAPGGFTTDGTSGGDDRSVDLSMISPDVLEGIEVFKALRPDLDGDAIGGTVNFTTRKAREGASTTLRMFGGYNDLEEDFGNYKGSLSYSNRFIGKEGEESKLGVVASGSFQKANRSSDAVGGSYSWTGEVNGIPVYETKDVTLIKHSEIRNRYGLNLALDYDLAPNHTIYLTGLWAGTKQDEKNQTHDYITESRTHSRTYYEREVEMNTFSNSLAGKHLFGIVEVDWTVSYSLSEQNTPWAAYFQFEEPSAFSSDMPISKINPTLVPGYALNNAYAAWLNSTYLQTENVKDRNTTAELNIKYPINLGSYIAGYLKAGGKVRYKNRDKELAQWGGNRWETSQRAMALHPDWFVGSTSSGIDIALVNFLSSNRKLDNFLSGDYQFVEVMDEKRLHWFANEFKKSVYEAYPVYTNIAQNYNAKETVYATYIMGEFNWQQYVTFMPGVRYEKTSTDYSTKVYNPATSGVATRPALNDSTGNRVYENFLPMFQMKIKPYDWVDLRLALTNSISRPDYYSLIPYERIDYDGATLRYGNPQLKETKATNYDAYLSFYNHLGLVSVGKFYKKLNDIDYTRNRKMTGGYYASYLTNLKGWTVINPDNLPNKTTVDGWEFELQTNFSFLPSPFDGILLYANYSIVHSETSYPYTIFTTKYISTAPYVVTTSTDTARVGRMLGQADAIANLTIGYEKGGFSSRLSMIYQGDALRGIGKEEANDELDDASVRWDLVVQQRILENLNIILQVNNITNQKEKTYIKYNNYLTRQEDYGMTMDLGFQLKL